MPGKHSTWETTLIGIFILYSEASEYQQSNSPGIVIKGPGAMSK